MSCLTRTRLRARLRARLWGKYLSKEGIRLWEAMSDERLLRACRDGDTDAFAVLWERHRRAGFVAARNLAPSLDPDDLVSDAYLKIFELVREGRGPQETFRPTCTRSSGPLQPTASVRANMPPLSSPTLRSCMRRRRGRTTHSTSTRSLMRSRNLPRGGRLRCGTPRLRACRLGKQPCSSGCRRTARLRLPHARATL